MNDEKKVRYEDFMELDNLTLNDCETLFDGAEKLSPVINDGRVIDLVRDGE